MEQLLLRKFSSSHVSRAKFDCIRVSCGPPIQTASLQLHCISLRLLNSGEPFSFLFHFRVHFGHCSFCNKTPTFAACQLFEKSCLVKTCPKGVIFSTQLTQTQMLAWDAVWTLTTFYCVQPSWRAASCAEPLSTTAAGPPPASRPQRSDQRCQPGSTPHRPHTDCPSGMNRPQSFPLGPCGSFVYGGTTNFFLGKDSPSGPSAQLQRWPDEGICQSHAILVLTMAASIS